MVLNHDTTYSFIDKCKLLKESSSKKTPVLASSGIDHHTLQSFLTELLDDLERVSYYYYEDFIVPSKVVQQHWRPGGVVGMWRRRCRVLR